MLFICLQGLTLLQLQMMRTLKLVYLITQKRYMIKRPPSPVIQQPQSIVRYHKGCMHMGILVVHMNVMKASGPSSDARLFTCYTTPGICVNNLERWHISWWLSQIGSLVTVCSVNTGVNMQRMCVTYHPCSHNASLSLFHGDDLCDHSFDAFTTDGVT